MQRTIPVIQDISLGIEAGFTLLKAADRAACDTLLKVFIKTAATNFLSDCLGNYDTNKSLQVSYLITQLPSTQVPSTQLYLPSCQLPTTQLPLCSVTEMHLLSFDHILSALDRQFHASSIACAGGLAG